MTFTDAAAEVLRLVGRPLHYKEITDIAIEKNLLSHVGKSPEVTMGARLAAMLKKDSPENPLIRVKPGVFALREWDEKTLRGGADKKKRGGKHAEEAKGRAEEVVEAEPEQEAEVEAGPEAVEPLEADDAAEPAEVEEPAEAAEEEADEVLVAPAAQEAREAREEPTAREPAEREPAERPSAPRAAAAPAPSPSRPGYGYAEEEEEEEAEPPGPDEAMRAEAVAGAAEIFDEEDDDDQPILGGDDRAASAADAGEGRRRRRRRRRGRSGGEVGPTTSGGGLPVYTATPIEARGNGRDTGRDTGRDAGPVETSYRPQVIEITGGDGHALDDLGGRDLADAVAATLATFDRNAGAVSLRQIAEAAQRRGKLLGDAQIVQSQVAAAVRADNARRVAAGQRPRFRFAGGRIALTDWLLTGELARLEQEALAAVERYRDAARRAFARKLGELPGHAFVEVCLLALERVGVSQIRAVRRPGAPGGESHFSGVLRPLGGDEVRVGLVIRRDGREIGRERVTELRGALHHYGPATVGWIMTAGQTLSGAREEASVPGAAPIALFDGMAIARLCEENDVAVLRARLPIAIPDVDLLEALRAS